MFDTAKLSIVIPSTENNVEISGTSCSQSVFTVLLFFAFFFFFAIKNPICSLHKWNNKRAHGKWVASEVLYMNVNNLYSIMVPGL